MGIPEFVLVKVSRIMLFLFFHLTQTNSVHVKQSKSVHPGGSVTFQCSLHSKNEENGKACTDSEYACRTACPDSEPDHKVVWFRAGPGESHPSIIYTPSRSSHEQDGRRCFYTLTKTVNVSDTGT